MEQPQSRRPPSALKKNKAAKESEEENVCDRKVSIDLVEDNFASLDLPLVLFVQDLFM